MVIFYGLIINRGFFQSVLMITYLKLKKKLNNREAVITFTTSFPYFFKSYRIFIQRQYMTCDFDCLKIITGTGLCIANFTLGRRPLTFVSSRSWRWMGTSPSKRFHSPTTGYTATGWLPSRPTTIN